MFFHTVIALSVVTSAFGFAPSARLNSNVRLSMSVETLPGVTGPLGFFDPLGLASKLDKVEASRYREAELKHGRVAMLAALGILTGEAIEFNTPLYGDKIVGKYF